MKPRAIAITLLTAVLSVVAVPAVARSPEPGPSDVIDRVSVVFVQLRDPDGGPLTADQQAAARAVIEARLAALPGPGATVTVTPDDRIRIDLADPSQLQTVSGVATAPGVFHIVGIPADRTDDVVEGEPLAGDMRTAPIIGPGHIADAWLGQDDLGQPVVNLEFDAQAAEAFDAWAVDHVGERVALLLDDVVVSAPVLQATRFDGRTQISGSFDTSRVQELVAILRGGPLPVLAEPLPDCLPIGCPIPSQPPGVTAPP